MSAVQVSLLAKLKHWKNRIVVSPPKRVQNQTFETKTVSALMERLFIYGSLQPGGPNEHVLAAIAGEWEPAVIQGNLVKAGWGADMGYPGLVLNESGKDVHGHVFASSNLSAQWATLDEFEGEEYKRVVASVTLLSGEQVSAHVYVLRAH